MSALVDGNLADAYRLQGRLEEAEQLYEASRVALERTVGPKHPHVAYILLGLARISASRGDWSKAKLLYDEGLEIWEPLFPAAHPTMIELKAEYANVLQHTESKGR